MVTSATGKKALAEGLDSAIAEAKTDAVAKPKPKPKPKAGKTEKKKEDTVGKQLQKDIKALLIQIETYIIYSNLCINMNLIQVSPFLTCGYSPDLGCETRLRKPENWPRT